MYRRLDRIANNSASDEVNESLSGFDAIKGEDSWIGCRVLKKFWIHKHSKRVTKFFRGTVNAVDDDADNPGHRIFEVRFDDGDVEWLSATDTNAILDKQHAQVNWNDKNFSVPSVPLR